MNPCTYLEERINESTSEIIRQRALSYRVQFLWLLGLGLATLVALQLTRANGSTSRQQLQAFPACLVTAREFVRMAEPVFADLTLYPKGYKVFGVWTEHVWIAWRHCVD